MNTESFIEKAQTIHGNKYDYSKAVYVTAKIKVEIVCSTHGSFWQIPGSHNLGFGCKECGKILSNLTNLERRYTTESFVAKAKSIHGNKYDYSKVVYGRNLADKIDIICPIHGEFRQAPGKHLTGGCSKCGADFLKIGGLERAKLSIDARKEEILKKFIETHSNKYDYSLVKYTSNKKKIQIICSEHGVFEQIPIHHQLGTGCPECSKEVGLEVRKITLENTPADIIAERQRKSRENRTPTPILDQYLVFERASKIHDDKYKYIDYNGMSNGMDIICPKHGMFNQRAVNHVNGQGCPKCSDSDAELEVSEFIQSISGNVISRSKKLIPPYELDIYLPNHKLAIEYNGLYYHSSYGPNLRKPKIPGYHQKKMLLCREAGIELLQIFEDEWVNPVKQEIWKSIIRHKLGLTINKIYARKCQIMELDFKTCSQFLDENHLMGKDSSPIRYGLTFEGKLVSVITFGKPSIAGGNQKYDFNIGRFSVLKDTTVVGGFSKLLKHFLKYHPNVTLSTAADLRYSTGDVYTKNGFKLTHETRPNYWYTKSQTRFHRFGFRKQLLAYKLEFYDSSLTEKQNMISHKWNIIYDAGNAMFELF